jgi:TRAP-type C4-dicarboxylate transport system permease small subunit
MLWGVDACMIATALFMLVYGVQLCITTWYQSISDFPGLSVGLTYLPIPIAGALTLLFIVERLWLGDPPQSSIMYSDQVTDLE